MLMHPHRQATTTPRVRAAIQAGSEPAPLPAGRFGITGQTVCKWRTRDSVGDGSHTPHRLQTTPTPSQEAVAVALRQTLPVWPDDLPAVVREFPNPNAWRSGLDRCLRRHGVGNLHDLRAGAPDRPARQRTMPSISGLGPAPAVAASAVRCSSVRTGVFPGALRVTSASAPPALRRNTRSRITGRPTPPVRAASLPDPPSGITARAGSRRV